MQACQFSSNKELLHIQQETIQINTRNSNGHKNGSFIYKHIYEICGNTTDRSITQEANPLVEIHWWHLYDLGSWKQALEDFIHLSNNIHPTIKFALNNSETEIAFLDTIIYRGKDNQILTRLYNKPTDNKQYLHYNSAHPWKQEKCTIWTTNKMQENMQWGYSS